MNFITALFIALISLSALAAPFDIKVDGLCFKNANPELRRFGPLGILGSEKGICQGMSGIVSAFHEHATFSPGKSKMTDSEARWAVNDLLEYHSGGCSKNKKIEIKGFDNLNEFCQAHKDLLMEKAIYYNTDIALREISWKLDQFYLFKSLPVNTIGKAILESNIQSLRKRLLSGRWPLMLYYSHVVTVHHMRYFMKGGKTDKIVFGIYDSNYATSQEYTIYYDTNGLPKSGQKMIWDTTPNRLTTICW